MSFSNSPLSDNDMADAQPDPSSTMDPLSGKAKVPLRRGDACLFCRRRKLKCNAEKPSCTNCLRAKPQQFCEYDRGKPKSRVKTLESKIAELESRLNGTPRPQPDPSESKPALAPSQTTQNLFRPPPQQAFPTGNQARQPDHLLSNMFPGGTGGLRDPPTPAGFGWIGSGNFLAQGNGNTSNGTSSGTYPSQGIPNGFASTQQAPKPTNPTPNLGNFPAPTPQTFLPNDANQSYDFLSSGANDPFSEMLMADPESQAALQAFLSNSDPSWMTGYGDAMDGMIQGQEKADGNDRDAGGIGGDSLDPQQVWLNQWGGFPAYGTEVPFFPNADAAVPCGGFGNTMTANDILGDDSGVKYETMPGATGGNLPVRVRNDSIDSEVSMPSGSISRLDAPMPLPISEGAQQSIQQNSELFENLLQSVGLSTTKEDYAIDPVIASVDTLAYPSNLSSIGRTGSVTQAERLVSPQSEGLPETEPFPANPPLHRVMSKGPSPQAGSGLSPSNHAAGLSPLNISPMDDAESGFPGLAEYFSKHVSVTDTIPPVLGAAATKYFDPADDPAQIVGGLMQERPPLSLPTMARNKLLQLYFSYSRQYGLFFNVERMYKRLEMEESRRPHPCWMYGMYLVAARWAQDPALQNLESHFFRVALEQFTQAVRTEDRLLDAVRGIALVTIHLYTRARYTEAWVTAGSATSLCLTLGLHKFTSNTFTPRRRNIDMFTGEKSLAPPEDSIELGDRIYAFWSIYYLDRAGAIATDLPRGVPTKHITTPFWLSFEHDVDQSQITKDDDHTIEDLLNGTPPRHDKDSILVLLIKGMVLLDNSREVTYLPAEEGVVFSMETPSASDQGDSPGSTPATIAESYYRERLPEHRTPNAFWKAKRAIDSFKASIPPQFIDPVRRNRHSQAVVDVDLVTLHSFVAAAEMSLYEPQDGYMSTPTALGAARRVMSLVTAIPENSYGHLHIYMAMILSKFVGRTMIAEVARLTKLDDYFGAAVVEAELDHVTRALRLFARTSGLAASQAYGLDQERNLKPAARREDELWEKRDKQFR